MPVTVCQVTLDFSLSEQVYAKAKVKDVTSVGLWLGADVMLDYPLEDARQLLVCHSGKLVLLSKPVLPPNAPRRPSDHPQLAGQHVACARDC